MIGWQLFYEGMWKIKTLKTPTPWTAAGYLRNSQGPFRNMFRKMTGDPDDLSWIESQPMPSEKKDAKNPRHWVPAVEKKWDAWQTKFARHHRLSDNQKKKLNGMINGSKTFEVELAELPPAVDFEAAKLQSVISYNAEKKRLVVDGVRHLIPAHRAILEKLVDADLDGIPNDVDVTVSKNEAGEDEEPVVDDDKDGIHNIADVDQTGGKDENKNGIDDSHSADKVAVYLVALKAAFKKSKDGMGYKEKLRAIVAGNPDWVEDPGLQRLGEVKKYKTMLAEYEADLANADQTFEWDHLQHTWGKIQAKRSELVGPVKALDKELKEKATEMLSIKQMGYGPAGEPLTSLRVSDLMTIAGLTILGACLIMGLLTRFSAIMGAVMLFMFYAAMPPWPNVPEAPGPEHSFIVNKNFIEVIALLAIACLPTGRWFGVDGMIGRWLGKRKLAKQAAAE